jgi:hypothetical protein
VNHRVFISYAGAQQTHADRVCALLEDDDIHCWMASRDCAPGTDWIDEIPAAVEQSQLVLVLLSPEALISDWVDRELNWAVSKERPLLPVSLGQTEPSPRFNFLFGRIQRTHLRERPTEAELRRLVSEVRDLLKDEGRVGDFVSEVEPAEAPATADPFVHRVSTARPAYFVLLVDHSSSMNRKLGSGNVRIREAVADVVNDLLFTLLRTSRRPDGYRHYFDVSVHGYGLGPGGEDVLPRLPEGAERMAIGSLNGSWHRIEESKRRVRLPEGGTKTVPVKRPIWVEPTPGKGRTVMAAAFDRAGELVGEWIAEHPDSLPPVVLNVSDGGWTGLDPMTAVRAVQEKATSLGPTLVLNCQLGDPRSPNGGRQLIFPHEIPPNFGRRTRELFMLSSPLPEAMREEARARGLNVHDDARGLVYNAPVSRLVDFLQVGTHTFA